MGLGAAGLALLLAVPAAADPPVPRTSRLTTAREADVRAVLAPTARPRLVHLWASWCLPCIAEWPELARAMSRWSARVDVVSLAIEEESGAEAERVLKRFGGVPGRALWSTLDDAYASIREVDGEWDGGYPTTYLLDSGGRLVLVQRGLTRVRELEAAIAKLAP